jgi:hypothetical protein
MWIIAAIHPFICKVTSKRLMHRFFLSAGFNFLERPQRGERRLRAHLQHRDAIIPRWIFKVSPARTIDFLPRTVAFISPSIRMKVYSKSCQCGVRPASWRDVHIDNAEASSGLLARHSDGGDVADQTDVKEHRQPQTEMARAAHRFARILQES